MEDIEKAIAQALLSESLTNSNSQPFAELGLDMLPEEDVLLEDILDLEMLLRESMSQPIHDIAPPAIQALMSNLLSARLPEASLEKLQNAQTAFLQALKTGNDEQVYTRLNTFMDTCVAVRVALPQHPS